MPQSKKYLPVKLLRLMMAITEAATGILLLVFPSLLITLLFDTSSNTPTELAVGRLAGAALCSLGIACWLARNQDENRAAVSLIAALLFYNLVACAIIGCAGLHGLQGVAFWPAIFFHSVMGLWCIISLRGCYNLH
jgi:hypothetical protein